jgi:hypothetical protein
MIAVLAAPERLPGALFFRVVRVDPAHVAAGLRAAAGDDGACAAPEDRLRMSAVPESATTQAPLPTERTTS